MAFTLTKVKRRRPDAKRIGNFSGSMKQQHASKHNTKQQDQGGANGKETPTNPKGRSVRRMHGMAREEREIVLTRFAYSS
jgi:hypothetical protein